MAHVISAFISGPGMDADNDGDVSTCTVSFAHNYDAKREAHAQVTIQVLLGDGRSLLVSSLV
jgi:hypothetical protein